MFWVLISFFLEIAWIPKILLSLYQFYLLVKSINYFTKVFELNLLFWYKPFQTSFCLSYVIISTHFQTVIWFFVGILKCHFSASFSPPEWPTLSLPSLVWNGMESQSIIISEISILEKTFSWAIASGICFHFVESFSNYKFLNSRNEQWPVTSFAVPKRVSRKKKLFGSHVSESKKS